MPSSSKNVKSERKWFVTLRLGNTTHASKYVGKALPFNYRQVPVRRPCNRFEASRGPESVRVSTVFDQVTEPSRYLDVNKKHALYKIDGAMLYVSGLKRDSY